MIRQLSRSAEETESLGRTFARSLRPGDVVALIGTLGSGKTRFVVGICDGLGVTARVTSPTFTIINEYPAPFGMVAHVDLYRIDRRGEIADLGLDEYFHARCICLIEWAEHAADLLPPAHMRVTLSHGAGEAEREILIDAGQEARA